MNDAIAKPAFPAARMLAYLTLAVGAMGTIDALVLPGIFGQRPGIAGGAIFMAVIVLLSGAICILPLVRADNSSKVVNAFMLGMLIRVTCGGIAAWVAIGAMGLPAIPVAASLMLAYLPALFIETRFIIRHIPKLDDWYKQMHGSSAGSAGASQKPAAAGADLRSENLA